MAFRVELRLGSGPGRFFERGLQSFQHQVFARALHGAHAGLQGAGNRRVLLARVRQQQNARSGHLARRGLALGDQRLQLRLLFFAQRHLVNLLHARSLPETALTTSTQQNQRDEALVRANPIKMLSPKLVCLDSSTWGRLAEDRESSCEVKSIVELLNSGALVPYFTWHHLEEICQHGSDEIYAKRVSLIDSLRFVAFPKLIEEVGNIGSLIDLRQLEIKEFIRKPTLGLQEIVDIVRPQITNGFCTGNEFCLANRPWWDLYRMHFSAERQAHKARVASLVQFPMGNQKQKVSDSLEQMHLRSETDAKVQFASMANLLADRLKKDGDPRLGDRDQIAY